MKIFSIKRFCFMLIIFSANIFIKNIFSQEIQNISSTNKKNISTPLHTAVLSGKMLDIITETIIGNKKNLNARNKEGQTPLHLAVKKKNNIRIVKYLVSMGARLDIKNKRGATPVHTAAINGFLDAIKLFLSKKIDINIKSEKIENTLLHFAVLGNRPKMVKFLIKKGANINATNNKNQTPLHLVFFEKSLAKYSERAILVAKTLLKNNSELDIQNKNTLQNPLHKLFCFCKFLNKKNTSKLVKYFVKRLKKYKPEKINFILNQQKDNSGYTAVEKINFSENNYLLQPLIDLIKNSPDIKNKVFIENNNEYSLEEKTKYSINFFDEDETRSKKEIIDLYGKIIQKFSEPRNLKELKELVESKIIDPDLKNKNKESILHIASLNGNIETVKFLIDNSVNINSETLCKETPLHLACLNRTPKSFEIVKYLIKNGANCNKSNHKSETPLHFALQTKTPSIEIIKLLLENENLNIETLDKIKKNIDNLIKNKRFFKINENYFSKFFKRKMKN